MSHLMKVGALVIASMLTAGGDALMAQPTTQPLRWTTWGDQGDGTYVNPVLPADYSDLDAIRVGDDYYAMSSTMQLSPGVVILHSKDLVNWRILSHAVADTTQISPEMNWDRMNRYGRGVWAGAMRHHAGRFWLYFGDPDEGFFMTSATDPAGPWEPLHPFWKVKGWDDCCPFWDDDGQGYFIASNFADQYKITLFKMTADNKGIVPDSGTVLYASKGSEANKLYKIDGTYYHFFSEVKSEGRVVMMRRAPSIKGPWNDVPKQLIHVSTRRDKSPNQGGIVQVPSGKWFFVTHHGTGDWEGRMMSVLPVNWVDGWPILGEVGADGVGNMVWKGTKPIDGHPPVVPQADEDFDGKLGVQWEWNYHPRADKFSLTERPGFLRLHAFKPLRPNDLLKAGNTLSQRSFRVEFSEVTVRLDVSGMADGQQAGLAHFTGRGYSSLGLVQSGDTRTLTYTENRTPTPGPTIAATTIWLRSTWGFDGKSTYLYSTDGKTFEPFGKTWQNAWGSYRGDRVGLYTFNDKGEAGHVDVDEFRYVFTKPPAIEKGTAGAAGE